MIANHDVDSDTPFSLAAAVLETIPVLTGTEQTGFAWTIYTGDLVSHDPENQLSRQVVLFFLTTRMCPYNGGAGIMLRTLKCAYTWTQMKFICTNSEQVLGL